MAKKLFYAVLAVAVLAAIGFVAVRLSSQGENVSPVPQEEIVSGENPAPVPPPSAENCQAWLNHWQIFD